MSGDNQYDVIIIGGSYSGLAAGMALGRAVRRVLIIDSGKPCNRQTPYSHNFLTQDGQPPARIAALARQQVEQYETIRFLSDRAVAAEKKTDSTFEVRTASGAFFGATQLILATGIEDRMPDIPGFADCWGISVLHCPYCHGYEVRNEKTGILGNGNEGFEIASLISNWTGDLTLFTNGPSTLTEEQVRQLGRHYIPVVETAVSELAHTDGHLRQLLFADGTAAAVKALYARVPFRQHSDLAEALGCSLTEEGYVQTDALQKTTVPGVFACGDNATRIRTVANAVAMGTTAGMMANREAVFARF